MQLSGLSGRSGYLNLPNELTNMLHDGIQESQQSSIWGYPQNVYAEWGSTLLKHPILSALVRIERQQTIFGCDRIETNGRLLPGGKGARIELYRR